jgi:hypothetical protein
MRSTILRASFTIVATLLLAACASNSKDVSGASTQGAILPQVGAVSRNIGANALNSSWLSDRAKAGTQLLFVADQAGQTVYIFPQGKKNPAPIGAIKTGVLAPDGLFVDRHGALYVCNFGAGTITVYPRGKTSPSKTLTGAGSAPIDVVVGLDGTVYVADFNVGQNGHIFEYAHGSTTPTTTINLTGYPEGLALDHANNLYAAYQKSQTAATVLKFAPGSSHGTDLRLPIVLVGGATIDSHDNLLVADQSNPSPHIDVFPPGAHHPSKEIHGFPLAFDIALNHANTRLYVTQPQNPAVVFEVSYPGGVILQRITNTITTAYGVATSPDGSP